MIASSTLALARLRHDLLPDLSGVWGDAGGGPQRYVLKHFENLYAPVVFPNTTYAVQCEIGCWWNVGFCWLDDYSAQEESLHFYRQLCCERDAGATSCGLVKSEDEIVWKHAELSEVWYRVQNKAGRLEVARKIDTVHIVFSSYYSVGSTDFINNIDNAQFHHYFPLAQQLSQSLREHREMHSVNNAFIFATYPWLMHRFLHCPCPEAEIPCMARTLGNEDAEPLHCPTQFELEAFSASARRGDFFWNAAPLDLQVESMSPTLVEASLQLLESIDFEFYRERRTRTFFSRSVTYMTRAVIPMLSKFGITALVIASGLDSSSLVPKVPKIHRWIDVASGGDIVVAYLPYGDTTQMFPDCAESPNGSALCVKFRSINSGPPASVSSIKRTLERVRVAYPNSSVKSSTFDDFMKSAMQAKELLPRFDLEVGDVTICGVASDPLKVAQSRAIQRIWDKCLQNLDARCTYQDPAIANMTFYLLKVFERSWGMSSNDICCNIENYDATFFRSRLESSSFMKVVSSWAEQRTFVELALRALSESGHPLAPSIRQEMDEIGNVSVPSLSALRYTRLDNLTDAIRIASSHGPAILRFRSDGALVGLAYLNVRWASLSSPLGAYVYKTFVRPSSPRSNNESESNTSCGVNAWVENGLWRPKLEELWLSEDKHSVVAVLSMPRKSYSTHGAPRQLYFNVSIPHKSHTPIIELSLTWIGKQPILGGEASVVTFQPAPRLVRAAPVSKILPADGAKEQHGSSPWVFNKLGRGTDPEAVVDGGSQFCHGVWGGVTARTKSGLFRIETLDAATVSPIGPSFPHGVQQPVVMNTGNWSSVHSLRRFSPGTIIGVAVNLHNNLWSDNYPLFFPFFDPRYCSAPNMCSDSNFKFRFRLHLGGDQDSLEPSAPSDSTHPSIKRKGAGFDPLALVAVMFLGCVAVLLGLRAAHYENSTDALLEELQDIDPDDRGIQLFSNRGLAFPLNGGSTVGLGGAATFTTLSDLRLGSLRMSERYSHMG